MKVPVYRALGLAAVAIGLVGTVLPLLPTTPFLIGAVFFFARSHPEWERRLLTHPTMGPAIRAWVDHQAIPLLAKRLATVPMTISAIGGWFAMPEPWHYLSPLLVAGVLVWIWTRPSR